MAMQSVVAIHTTAQEPQESPLSFFGRARVRLETLIQHGETSLRDLYVESPRVQQTSPSRTLRQRRR